jgi:TonB family protein
VNISADIAEGRLLQKTTPIYPPIAEAAHVSGTVVLQATISKTGSIEDLRVVSGPAMLQQSALDAVKTWRYRPYLLYNEPVEVETTVNLIYILGDGNAAPSAAASAEPTAHEEVEKIRSQPHGQMPPAQISTVAPTLSGTTAMTVKNSTPYELSVFYDGPVSKKLTLAPGTSQTLDLVPGAFHVAGRVSAANVLPFYGEETYAGSASYSATFYIAP